MARFYTAGPFAGGCDICGENIRPGSATAEESGLLGRYGHARCIRAAQRKKKGY